MWRRICRASPTDYNATNVPFASPGGLYDGASPGTYGNYAGGTTIPAAISNGGGMDGNNAWGNNVGGTGGGVAGGRRGANYGNNAEAYSRNQGPADDRQ